jgi:hypothetical protein
MVAEERGRYRRVPHPARVQATRLAALTNELGPWCTASQARRNSYIAQPLFAKPPLYKAHNLDPKYAKSNIQAQLLARPGRIAHLATLQYASLAPSIQQPQCSDRAKDPVLRCDGLCQMTWALETRRGLRSSGHQTFVHGAPDDVGFAPSGGSACRWRARPRQQGASASTVALPDDAGRPPSLAL